MSDDDDDLPPLVEDDSDSDDEEELRPQSAAARPQQPAPAPKPPAAPKPVLSNKANNASAPKPPATQSTSQQKPAKVVEDDDDDDDVPGLVDDSEDESDEEDDPPAQKTQPPKKNVTSAPVSANKKDTALKPTAAAGGASGVSEKKSKSKSSKKVPQAVTTPITPATPAPPAPPKRKFKEIPATPEQREVYATTIQKWIRRFRCRKKYAEVKLKKVNIGPWRNVVDALYRREQKPDDFESWAVLKEKSVIVVHTEEVEDSLPTDGDEGDGDPEDDEEDEPPPLLVRDGEDLVKWDDSANPTMYRSTGPAFQTVIGGNGGKSTSSNAYDDADDTQDLDEPVPDTIIASALGQAATGMEFYTLKPVSGRGEPMQEIHLSEDSLKWIHRMAGNRHATLLYKRLTQLAAGERTYCLAKPLKHHPRMDCVIYETKLDKGQRILWTERMCSDVSSVLVWYISKHDKVNFYMDQIDESFRRRLYKVPTGDAADTDDDTLLVNPASNNLLRTYYVKPDQLPLLTRLWTPPLKLTAAEIQLVEREGSVLLLGRGGTGKTLCLTSRMHRDQQRFLNVNQLFVSYTHHMTATIKSELAKMTETSEQQKAAAAAAEAAAGLAAVSLSPGDKSASSSISAVATAATGPTTSFFKMTKLVRHLWREVHPENLATRSKPAIKATTKAAYDDAWPLQGRIDFFRFRDEFWPQVQPALARSGSSPRGGGGGGSARSAAAYDEYPSVVLDALTVWTQIRSFLKGSIEAANQRTPLALEQYTDLTMLTTNRCRLDRDSRNEVYGYFLRYEELKKAQRGWDEADTVMDAMNRLQDHYQEQLQTYAHSAVKWKGMFDRIYVDEVQDLTQAEIGLLYLAVGYNGDALFFAGDTAQSIAYGVEFRFEEVRSCIYHLTRGTQRLDRVERLTRNFRSHDGILSVANAVLDTLFEAFPRSTDIMHADTGIATGPRPGFMKSASDEDIARLCLSNPKLRLLTWDEYVPVLAARLKAAARALRPSEGDGAGKGIMVFGIRDIKGMEFSEVAIIDFFSASKPADDARLLANAAGGLDNHSGLRVTGAWQALTANDHNAWKWLLLKSGDEVKLIPQELNVQLKILYTAITRSASRLLFIESSVTKAGDAWCRFLSNKDLGKQVKAEEARKEAADAPAKMMLPDDWKCEGLTLASRLEDNPDPESVLGFLHKIKDCFDKARLEVTDPLMSRIVNHMLALQVDLSIRGQPRPTASDMAVVRAAAVKAAAGGGGASGGAKKQPGKKDAPNYELLEKKAAMSAQKYIEVGLYEEASRLCQMWCMQPGLAKLHKRIMRLQKNDN